ncbi:MAG TPA: sigma factor-like helix-turn-helix DNA-binding protein, partial [Flavihumibacter sp.]|nr:sigma factor-like helix-turn-helix DNA-binding protein [Flavihumibacter sp.]
AIDKLTKRQKQAISLRYFDNHSYTDIAAIMAISVDAVYNLVSKALDSIQKNLQKADPAYLN